MSQASAFSGKRDSGNMDHLVPPILPILLSVVCVIGLALALLLFSRLVRPGQPGRVTRMPYESGMDPIHDTRRRFDVRFYLLAIAFLVFDVELLFLYPWAVVAGERQAANASIQGMGTSVPIQSQEVSPSPPLPVSPSTPLRHSAFIAVMVFVALLTVGFVYDWRKGVFRWR
jgi:NADH-quinone oxidoreductase subunit A